MKTPKEVPAPLPDGPAPEGLTCCRNIWTSGSTWRGNRCARKAAIVANGKPYCRIHDPAAEKKRRADSETRFKVRFARQQAAWKAENAHRAVASTVMALFDAGANDLPLAIADACRAYRAASTELNEAVAAEAAFNKPNKKDDAP